MRSGRRDPYPRGPASGVAEPDAMVIDGDTRRLLGGLFEYRALE
jgi:hypothetical protein